MLFRSASLVSLVFTLSAWSADYPLEAVKVSGTTIRTDKILELAGMQIGAPMNKESIDAACDKLQLTGLFSAVEYQIGRASCRERV